MDLERHPRFHTHGVGIRAGGHRDRFLTDHRRNAFDVHMFIGAVAVDVAAEIDVRSIELLEGLGDFHREPDDLIRHELFFQRRARLGAVVHHAGRIAAVKAVGRAMVARVGIVKHVDDHAALQGAGSGHRRHVEEVFILDCLEGPFRDLSAVLPACADGVGEIVGRLGDGLPCLRCLGLPGTQRDAQEPTHAHCDHGRAHQGLNDHGCPPVKKITVPYPFRGSKPAGPALPSPVPPLIIARRDAPTISRSSRPS